MNSSHVPWTVLVALLFLAPPVAAADAQGSDVRVQRLERLDDSVGPVPVPDAPRVHPPLPPGDLGARIDGAAVELAWDAPPDGAPAAYRIYRMDAPNGAWKALHASALHAAWQPLQQVPGNTTTFRDADVDLARQHYVYVVTAVHAAPLVSLDGWSTRAAQDGTESPPSNPAYTWNTFTHCSWFDLNLPHGSGEPEVHPECIVSNQTLVRLLVDTRSA